MSWILEYVSMPTLHSLAGSNVVIKSSFNLFLLLAVFWGLNHFSGLIILEHTQDLISYQWYQWYGLKPRDSKLVHLLDLLVYLFTKQLRASPVESGPASSGLAGQPTQEIKIKLPPQVSPAEGSFISPGNNQHSCSSLTQGGCSSWPRCWEVHKHISLFMKGSRSMMYDRGNIICL